MPFLFPRIYAAPVRCGPVRHDVAPLFSLFDETFSQLQRVSQQARRQFNPRFDLKETKEAYSLEGELPGLDQKDLNIEFTDEHTLTIKGRTERHSESGRRPEAVETEKKAAIDDTAASETSSPKSHQPSVEDEEPANSSAAQENKEVAAPTPAPAQPAKVTKPTQDQQYWISERSVGEFSRSFSFPARVNQEAVKASLRNGILSIVVPKAPAPESRRINIE
jgi:HSP20 family molecular chaperone IbpA